MDALVFIIWANCYLQNTACKIMIACVNSLQSKYYSFNLNAFLLYICPVNIFFRRFLANVLSRHPNFWPKRFTAILVVLVGLPRTGLREWIHKPSVQHWKLQIWEWNSEEEEKFQSSPIIFPSHGKDMFQLGLSQKVPPILQIAPPLSPLMPATKAFLYLPPWVGQSVTLRHVEPITQQCFLWLAVTLQVLGVMWLQKVINGLVLFALWDKSFQTQEM